MDHAKLITDSHPRIQAALASGLIRWDGGELVGTASDGVEVGLGSIYLPTDADATERYLAAHPTPDTW